MKFCPVFQITVVDSRENETFLRVISMSHNICYVYFLKASSYQCHARWNRLNHSPRFNLAKKSDSTGKIPSKRTGIGNGEQIRFTMNDTMAPCKFSFSVGKNDKEEWNNVILGANSPALSSIHIFLTEKQNRNLICIYLIVCTPPPFYRFFRQTFLRIVSWNILSW